jgi:beta-lactam-binding protein with PASTA domain
MPNVVMMTREEALSALRQAGFSREVNFDTSACGSTIDNTTVVELGRVCYQAPAAGHETSTGSPVSLRVQNENPWRGELSSGRFWFLMPDFSGASLDVARAKLRALGFTAKEPLISYVEEAGCRPNVVCRTSPERFSRADNTSDKVLYVGQPPGGAAPPSSPKPTAATAAPASTAKAVEPQPAPPPAKPADIF